MYSRFEKRKKMNQRRIALVVLLCMGMASVLTGCEKINKDTKIVLTVGFTEDEIFRIETASC